MDNDRNAPATKGDLTDAIHSLEARLTEAITEAIHDSETAEIRHLDG